MKTGGNVDKKRTRISLACLRCRQRKIKCDGADICQHCRVARAPCEHVRVTQEQNEAARARKLRAKAKRDLESSSPRSKTSRLDPNGKRVAAKHGKRNQPDSPEPLTATNGMTISYPPMPLAPLISPNYGWHHQEAGQHAHQSLVPRGYYLSPELNHPMTLPQEAIHPTQPHLDALMRHGLSYGQEDLSAPLHPLRPSLPYPIQTNLSSHSITPHHYAPSHDESTASSSHHRAMSSGDISGQSSALTTPAEQPTCISNSPVECAHCALRQKSSSDAISAVQTTYLAPNVYSHYVPQSLQPHLASLEDAYRRPEYVNTQ
ncbi:uncharacterized protein L969DRAFT_51719 [Mixia osmundae IAM 14324]|uniref:Zn(2)-C6 fungal-type domain-containing protein n=1 Tax=Mixia osmundae (strain CBS 9802 / IAM 14324 / JCM 22182 / KY 12970) TaxID=764103 RepID=G7DSI3_MIXOS|nr:uncharacterized protein L969DRAFT_51719 [Mixia osmundae IAM 14324]KEI37959.1 hypothetical protein L969DRAFT_51719 [Mixia osmundae IAM 14324]GAA93543.1 hypothetical protein E5Q_00187 [Mixia osmundae IAM 14324]